MSALTGALHRDDVGMADTRISADQLADLLQRINDGTISGRIAKDVFEALWQGEAETAARLTGNVTTCRLAPRVGRTLHRNTLVLRPFRSWHGCCFIHGSHGARGFSY